MQRNAPFNLANARPRIDYSLVAKAVEYYETAGYTYIEVPWLASEQAIRMTYPGESPFVCQIGYLPGSAEQSFLHMALENAIEPKKFFVAASPCYRDDPVDELHQISFFKVELFVLGLDEAERMVYDAEWFFRGLGMQTRQLQLDGQVDILSKDIELGSYGTRTVNGITWSYGTGLAEPRTSLVRSKS